MNMQHKVVDTFLSNKSIGVQGVARKLGISTPYASRLLKRSAVDAKAIRKQLTAQTHDKMRSLHAQGLTPKQIADDMCYTADYVQRVVEWRWGDSRKR